MKQLVQLQAKQEAFSEKNIGLVVLTYDSEADQKKFTDRYDIEVPLVSDIERSTVTTLGILNDQIEPDSMAYGVPYPGFFVLDNAGTIRDRSFLEGYEKRLDAETVLSIADTALTK